MIRRVRWFLLIGSLMGIALLDVTGCAFKGSPSQGMGTNARGSQPAERGGQAPPGQLWAPEPTAMRIYPSTRFVRDDQGVLLEARIELFDQMGDSIKSSGKAQFALYAAQRGGDRTGQLLYQWQLTLRTLKDQRQYYDPIFRGYAFRLRIDAPSVARRPVILSATFSPPQSERLTTEARVRGDW